MESVKQKVREVFEKSQERRYNLTKLAETLKNYYVQCEEKQMKTEFVEAFRTFVECVLQTESRESPAERCVQFVSKFAALFANTYDEDEEIDEEEDENLYNYLLKFMIEPEYHSHSSKTIRFRVCQLIQLMLSAVPRDAAMDEDLMDEVAKAMLHRIQDKLPTVRCQAARALSRLQQPSLHNCPVISAYLFHMSADDSSQVRSTVLSCISLTTKTLPEVLDRTRDVAEAVRKTAFQILAQKVSIKALTSCQRLYLIKQGLFDQSAAVRDVVKKQLFQAWLLTFQANLLDLLKKLDVIGAFETSTRCMVALFETSKLSDIVEGFTLLNERKLIEYEKLTPESALYWCQLCDFLRNQGSHGEYYIDNLLPNVIDFCDYTQEYFTKHLFPIMDCLKNADGSLSQSAEDEKIEKEFVAEQLLKLASKMDVSDNTGRQRTIELLEMVINKLDVLCFPCLITPVAHNLIDLQSSTGVLDRDENEKVQLVASLITNAREPASPAPTSMSNRLSEQEVVGLKMQIAKLSVQLNEEKENLNAKISLKSFEEAASVQQNIDEMSETKLKLEEQLTIPQNTDIADETQAIEKCDAGTFIKCLKILSELLTSLYLARVKSAQSKKRSRGVHPTILSLLDTLVIPCVLDAEPEVRKEAIITLGTSCLFSRELATQHFALMTQVAQADTYMVRVAAINAINDFIRFYGIKALVAKKPNKETSLNEEGEKSPDKSINEEEVSNVLMDKFIEMLDDEEVEIRHAVVCLLSRVLVSHRILSPTVFSRLILLWYNPATQDDPEVVHAISDFLNTFPYMSKEAHGCVEAAFLPIIRVLFNAPHTSPLASVNIENVTELLITITQPSVIQKADIKHICNHDMKWLDEASAHDDLANMVACEVLSDPSSPFVNTLCKVLPMLELNPKQQDNLKDVAVLCENILKEVKNKPALKHIKKFQSQVKSLLSKTPPTINILQDEEEKENAIVSSQTTQNSENLESRRSPMKLRHTSGNRSANKSARKQLRSFTSPTQSPKTTATILGLTPKRNLTATLDATT
uniref:Condensin complex subunit 3 n=1 Tax=Phallusia mammillata TaxID=59560 RepID=A0A6F9DLA0_9ASCI|nr:condensin complex subunit 3 [Phallusia mammillata]